MLVAAHGHTGRPPPPLPCGPEGPRGDSGWMEPGSPPCPGDSGEAPRVIRMPRPTAHMRTPEAQKVGREWQSHMVTGSLL